MAQRRVQKKTGVKREGLRVAPGRGIETRTKAKTKAKNSGQIAGGETKKEETKPRLRIHVRAYDHTLTDSSARQIVEAAQRQGITVVGPIPLPTEIKRYTVQRSTFKHKDSREQFEVRVHKRLIDIDNPTAKTIEALTHLNLPAGVDVDIKMTT